MLKKYGTRLSVVLMIMIAVTLGVVLVIIINDTSKLTSSMLSRESKTANNAFVEMLKGYQTQALERAEMIAGSEEIVNAVINGDDNKLLETLNGFSVGFDLITLCSADGNVLTRTHSDKKGDSILNQNAISVALSTGKGISTIEPGTVIGLSTRGSAAIKDKSGNIIGALTCGHDLSQAKYIDAFKKQNNCEATFFAGNERMNTTLIDEQGNRVIGTKASEKVIETVINQKQNYTGRVKLFGNQYEVYYSPLVIENDAIGMLFTGVMIDDVLQQERSMYVLISIGAFMLLLAVLITLLLIKWITKKSHWYESILDCVPYPVSVTDMNMNWTFINKAVEQLLNVRRSDVLGKHCSSWGAGICKTDNCGIECLRKGMKTTFFEQMGMDFQVDINYLYDQRNKQEGHIEIVQDISERMKTQKAQTELVNKIHGVCDAFTSASENIANSSQALAQGSTEQASSVEELSASISEISEKTKQNANMSDEAVCLSADIKNNAEKGSGQMDNLMQAVKEINNASQNISKIIKVIDDIAFQTNILALNAAVEAARAGQHGKGFAVVAEEVRKLASKSAEAAKDTSGMIENSIEKSNLGLNIANETSASLREIVDGINRSAEIVTQIAQSSDEQALAISQINTGIDQVSQVIQQNSATAQESAASSEEMSGQASLLQELIGRFNHKKNSANDQTDLPVPHSERKQLTAAPGIDSFGKY